MCLSEVAHSKNKYNQSITICGELSSTPTSHVYIFFKYHLQEKKHSEATRSIIIYRGWYVGLHDCTKRLHYKLKKLLHQCIVLTVLCSQWMSFHWHGNWATNRPSWWRGYKHGDWEFLHFRFCINRMSRNFHWKVWGFSHKLVRTGL